MRIKPLRRWALALAALAALSAAPARAVSPQADSLILSALDAAYGMDFDRCESLLKEVDRLEPESPAGPFFLASLKWLEFSQNADVPGTLNSLEPQFDAIMDQAVERAQALHSKNPDDPEANFYLGAIYGMKGRWRLLKRQWIRAASDGYKGYKYLKKTIELDPQYYDAYLGLGMYDYYSDTLPNILKFTANMIVRGDKQRGLRYVQLTMEKGHYSATEAKLFLAGIYAAYEKQPIKALALVEELRRQRPDNLFFTLMEVMVRIDMQDWNGAIAFGEFLWPRVRAASYAKPHISLFDLYLGEAYLGAKDYEKAVETLTRCIVQAPEPRKATVTFCRMRRAQARDLLGQREAAVLDWEFVRRRPDFFESQSKAKRALKRPFTYEEVLGQLSE